MTISSLKKIILLFLLSIFNYGIIGNLHSQICNHQIKFEHFTIKDGLSQSVINTIIQDKRGFLWFGTQEGLNRYDGYEFKKFYHDPQNPNSMSAKHINYLVEQKDAKVLWIGTEGGGLDRFDLETQEFRHYQHFPDDSTSLSSNFITGLEFSSSRYLWAATNQHGLNRLDLTTGHIKQYHFQKNNEKSISSEGVTTLFKDSQERLWVGLNTAVLERYDAENEQFIHFSFQDKFDSEFILDIVEINNKLWLATNKSILIYDPEKERIESFTGKTEGLPPDFRVEKLCVESVDHLWAAAVEKGLYLFDLKNKTFHNFAFNPSDPFGISNNIIGDLYKDTIGNIWIGTRGTGIDAIKKRNKNFYIYQHSSINPFSISHNNIWQIYEDPDFPGKIYWIATSDKLNKFDFEKKIFTRLFHDPKNINSISSNNIIALYKDSKKNLWIGTYKNGLSVLNTETNKVRRFTYDPANKQGIGAAQIFCITGDNSGKIWIGTSTAGIDCYHPQTDGFTHYTSNPEDTTTLDNNLIWSLFIDKDNILWVGTNNGLNKFNPESNTFHRINNSLINGSVFYINAAQNNKNILWLCTEFGLIRFNKNTEVCYKYNNDLKRESVFCALPDQKGNLWLSTNRGLFQFNPETGRLRSFFESDGLPSNEFNYAAFSKNNKTNELIFGGVNGLVIFNPGDIQRNTLPPSVVLTDFKIFNQSIGIDNYHLKKSITEAEKINLSYKDNIFTFSFAALDFLAPEKNIYAFKMENLNNEWNYIDNRRFTTYANLPPGNYTFRVKAANSDGIWNAKGASVKIIIKPPFYQTTFFKILLTLLFAFTLYFIYKIRVRYITRQKNKLSKKVKERTEALKQEIAERKATEQKLEERQKYLFSILQHTPEAIVVTDPDQIIVEWNPGAEKIFLYSKEEIIGKNLNDLVVGKGKRRESINLGKKVLAGNLVPPLETIRVDKNGKRINVIVAASPIIIEEKLTGMVIVYTDITKQKKYEEQLQKSLAEKNILLKEIHHRVKNNLAVISSLLSLQSKYLDDKKAKEMFQESRNRVLTMMKIHEKLYKSLDITKVDFKSYIQSTVNNLFKIYGINWDNISYTLDIKDISLPMEKAIPCGLIINELVTNSLKYAFHEMGDKKGIIEILMHRSNGNVELIVRDNGKGITGDIDLKNSDSLGLKLVDILSKGQLDGDLNISSKEGTEFKIKFAVEE